MWHVRGRWRLALGAVAVAVVVALWPIAERLAFHFLPLSWTGEARTLAAVLDVKAGQQIAEIGAGRGAMAIEIAGRVGDSGTLYATELSEERLADLRHAAERPGLARLVPVRAAETSTNLPAACCDAVYMRNVAHHVQDLRTYAGEIRKALRPGGQVAVIDFAPGAFFHLAGAHGASQSGIREAFVSQGFTVSREIDDWGGGLFLMLFTLPS